jgi:LAS superfamily LD-carboxypeptidase LdcB
MEFENLKNIAKKAGFSNEFTTEQAITNIEDDAWFFGEEKTTYIRFAALLEFIEKTQLIYTKQDKPLINFDYKIGKSYMITNKWVISPNPTLLLINPGSVSLSDTLKILQKSIDLDQETQFTILDSLPEFKRKDDGFNSEIGDIMNIYLEVDKVFDILLENTNEKTGAVSIFKFLDSICSVINSTLGNLSSIAPFIDESTNTLSIIEEGELPHKDKLLKELEKTTTNQPLQLHGYSDINTSNPKAGFVKSFNLKTEITNDLATMVTIGAQASGEIVKGIDATAFASWNRGLIDRIIPIKKADTKEETVTEEKTDGEKKGDLLKKYETGLGNYVAMLDAYSNNDFEEDDIPPFTSGLKAIIDYNKELIKLEKEIKDKNTPSVTQQGFLPINLNLTLDGISGPTILQQFEIQGGFLPHPIPDTLTFLIKGVSHKISNNVWTTTIDSLSVPKFVKSSTTTTTSTTTTSNNTRSAGSTVQPLSGEDPAVTYFSQDKFGKYGDKNPIKAFYQERGFNNGVEKLENELTNFKETNPNITWILNSDVIPKLHPEAATALVDLYQAYIAEFGKGFRITSSFRTLAKQKALFAKYGRGKAATPGTSNHGWGGAIDIGELYILTQGSINPLISKNARIKSDKYKWFAKNGPTYGWYQPWLLCDNRGSDEVWHWEYWSLKNS